ncbi:HupE/UreJ family protein [Streptomyces sp. NPDC058001]|uniref:HupE/UreJ family protein n=1 Tax=Streptomyces sp. NPDC058001 TaxID=3346300 RepID=UPI0036E88A33
MRPPASPPAPTSVPTRAPTRASAPAPASAPTPAHRPGRPLGALLTVLAALAMAFGAGLLQAAPAAAHDATTNAYAEVTGSATHPEATLDLEYDLLMKSAWLYADAYDAKDRAEQLRQLRLNADAVSSYVTGHFAIARDDTACTARTEGDADIRTRGKRAYAVLTVAYTCQGGTDVPVTISSALFPDAESFVHSTRTIVHYDIDGQRGSQILTVTDPSVTAAAADGQESHQVWEFFLLGTEHLLFGLDHILFLLSLLIGARGLRDIVLTATTFTVAHSITFLLAACGVVDVPAAVVEPVIAASIAVVAVAGFVLRDREDNARWRLPTVFVFGLVHGLGFAGSLGIDESWSWELLVSLLSFNVGVEAVQLGIIAVVFPLLLLLRRSPVHRWVLPALTAPIVVVSLYWLWDRVAVSA